MHPMTVRQCAAALLFLFGSAAPALAQVGSVQVQVAAAESGEPLANAQVQLLGPDERPVASGLTDAAGRYRHTGVEPGVYTVVVLMIGYEPYRLGGVRVGPGETATVTAQLRSSAFSLNPVVVTASRRQEKALEAPAHVIVASKAEIQAEPAATVVDHLRGMPGVDVASSGLVSSNVTARGFNNVFSGALLMLTDNRIASVPSLRVNASYLIPTSNEDIERIEVVLGPGAALYGPGSAGGVLHVITESPFDAPGTTLTVAGGGRAESNAQRFADRLPLEDEDLGVYHLSGRHAARLSERFAFKLSGQYFRGGDWHVFDAIEDATRDSLIHKAGADPDTLRIGNRDFTTERWAGEARLDFRPDLHTEAIFSAGTTTAVSAIEMTGLGAAQARDWRYTYYQARFRRDRLFAQLFLNTSNAGETFILPTGLPIVDKSRMFVAQLQHGFDLSGRQSFIYGLDYQRTEPRTDSTITGRNEADDLITEVGGYVHSETRLADRLNLVAALRADKHSHVEDLTISPRLALVFTPEDGHNFRITYNRAFSSPTTNNLFLDLQAASLGGLYQVRALGVPETGLRFRRDCGGDPAFSGLCVRSPLNPGTWMPVDGTLVWRGLVALARENVLRATGVDLAQIPAPTAAEVASVLRGLNTTTRTFEHRPAEGVVDVDPIKPTITNTFEIGYKGLLGERLMIAADAYYTRRNDFVGPLIVETPNVFLNREQLAAYLTPHVQAQGRSPILAQAIASGLAGVPGNPAFPGVPLATVLPDHQLVADNALILTYRNFGEVDLFGADAAAQLLLGDRFSVTGSYSWVSKDFFTPAETGGGSPVALNAPKHKGSVAGEFRDRSRGINAEVRIRYSGGFPMNSGVYIGEVDAYTLVDARVGYRLPFAPGVTATISAQNVLNNMHREFVGAPELGRLVLGRLQYSF